MFVRGSKAAAFSVVLAMLLSGQGAWALGSTVHVGQTCQALYDKCIARAVKAPQGSPLTLASCDDALTKAIATPLKSADPGVALYLWPQMGPSLPEKCSN